MRTAFVVARYSDTSTTCDTESAPMLKLLSAYTTNDGHTAKIAARIASGDLRVVDYPAVGCPF